MTTLGLRLRSGLRPRKEFKTVMHLMMLATVLQNFNLLKKKTQRNNHGLSVSYVVGPLRIESLPRNILQGSGWSRCC